ncbi:unnamed protein product [Linum trigynum]|uniref:Uncharacterized protein n=1 Tax=Linum trigynum TaxID=586398 RepID=A0AAV2F7H4_9ROSI
MSVEQPTPSATVAMPPASMSHPSTPTMIVVQVEALHEASLPQVTIISSKIVAAIQDVKEDEAIIKSVACELIDPKNKKADGKNAIGKFDDYQGQGNTMPSLLLEERGPSWAKKQNLAMGAYRLNYGGSCSLEIQVEEDVRSSWLILVVKNLFKVMECHVL